MVEDRARRRYLQLLAAGGMTALAGCSTIRLPGTAGSERIDDWQYDPEDTQEDSGWFGGGGENSGIHLTGASGGAQTSAESVGWLIGHLRACDPSEARRAGRQY